MVNFVAYYPYLPTITALDNYAVDVASQGNQAAIDLLWSKNTEAKSKISTGNVVLTFDHKLSKIILKTTAGIGLTATDLEGMTVSINGMNTKADFSLETGALSNPTAVAAIAPRTATDGKEYEAIVLPANFAVGALTITFKIGNDTFTWKNLTLDDGKIEASKEYTYNMTISPTGVDFNCTINNWTTVSRSGTAN